MPEHEPRPRRPAPPRDADERPPRRTTARADPDRPRRRPPPPPEQEDEAPAPRRRRPPDAPPRTAHRRRPESSEGSEPPAERRHHAATGTRRAEPERLTARGAAARAADCVQELTGRSAEGITSLKRTEDGWQVGVEVLEARRIPDSTDILAEYGVVLDADGELVSYRRNRRYHRGRANEELS
ncbi:gas vesicle protein GvpO [Kitasatospora sp. NPDC093550]|uniref:gas vesicle protein GvpO n=1 Tax=Kitasatospora sp. NPDC093550 TaxID=3364089 RepID=UPI00380F575F